MFNIGDEVKIIAAHGHYIPYGMKATIKQHHPADGLRERDVYFLTTDCGHEQLVQERDFVLFHHPIETNESAMRFLKRGDLDV